VSATVASAHAEFLADALGEAALSVTTLAPPRSKQATIEALYGEPPDQAEFETRMAIVAAALKIKPPRFIIRKLPRLDWLKKVYEDFPPLPIARWVVFGALHKAKALHDRRLPLQIDATSAFGTGEHPTTRGCLLMLDWLLKKTHRHELSSMLDMGCGTGILAMAFAKAHHGMARGVDLDPDSVAIARDNIRVNSLQPSVRVALGRGYTSPFVHQGAPYDLIMANIFARPLCHMAHDLAQHLRPGGWAILSGILNHQANAVIAAHRLQGIYLQRRMILGEWSVLAMQRPMRAQS
jgi:ribosomal protein L11 methyltransferase